MRIFGIVGQRCRFSNRWKYGIPCFDGTVAGKGIAYDVDTKTIQI